MSLIDNRNQTLQDALKNALITADRIDIAGGHKETIFRFTVFFVSKTEVYEAPV